MATKRVGGGLRMRVCRETGKVILKDDAAVRRAQALQADRLLWAYRCRFCGHRHLTKKDPVLWTEYQRSVAAHQPA